MGNLTIATTFIVLLNVMMWFSQLAMLNINPDGSACYDVGGSVIAGSSINNDPSSGIINNDVYSQMPDTTGSNVAQSGSGGFVTDLFNSIINWFKTAPGIKYIYGVIAAPYNILKCMGLPNEVVAGLGTFWYLVSFLVLLSFLWWRD